MKSLYQILSIISENKDSLKRKYRISKIGVFGSYSRNEATEESDVDIIVEFEEPIGLDFVLLAEELESLIGNKVDLVSSNAVKPKIKKYIDAELVYV
ncbi:MAG TPA: nucleotidyltransferase family protein [Ignavibacteriaceae bacterium]|nr:nucleotidyltransferase family protein [Ignavibacteriaceae bacterium]